MIPDNVEFLGYLDDMAVIDGVDFFFQSQEINAVI